MTRKYADISDFDIDQFTKQEGVAFPYRFSVAFNSLWEEREDALRRPCPRCGDENLKHLGSFLSSDIWNNVFACEKCKIAWCMSDQSREIACKSKAARDLVKTLYDSEDEGWEKNHTGVMNAYRKTGGG